LALAKKLESTRVEQKKPWELPTAGLTSKKLTFLFPAARDSCRGFWIFSELYEYPV